jgi:hypothetical protein
VSTNGNGAHSTRVQEIDLRALDLPRLDGVYAAPGARAPARVVEEEPFDGADEPLVDTSSDNLRRYARWQALDFLRNRAIWLLPLGLLALWIFRDNYDAAEITRGMAAGGGGRRGGVDSEPTLFRQIVLGLSGAGALLGSLIATVGIVARERERGLQRFLFAKPVSITRYYLQAFAINGVGLMAVLALMLACTSVVFFRPVPFLDAMTLGAVSYVMLGGFAFLLSTLVRFDFAAAGIIGVLSVPVFAAGERWRYPLATVGRWLLPPLPALAELIDPRASVVPGGPVAAVALCLAYGVACVAGALVVLRRRSITT